MKILFVMKFSPDKGSIHALANYMRVGARLGHTVALYGPPQADTTDVHFSTDAQAFDRVIFLFESDLYRVHRLQEATLLGTFPRERRFVLDADGMYNPVVVVDDYDRNYQDETERTKWLRLYDALADRIFQPTLRAPCDRRVTGLPFYAYDPAQVVEPTSAPAKRFDVLHVGHNWWRWQEMAGEILPGLESIRDEVGEIAFIGLWWSGGTEWAQGHGLEAALHSDTEKLKQLRIQCPGSVPYREVIWTMSTARVNIFTQRPLLRRLRHLTLRYFEVFAADTVPLLMLEPELAEAVYGPAARELTLKGRVAEKVLDALHRPEHYREIVEDVRRYLCTHHRFSRRVEELVAALQN